MKRVSSILFALSIFGGVAYADSDYSEVRAELTFDRSLLQEEGGAKLVLTALEKQAEKACSKVSLLKGTTATNCRKRRTRSRDWCHPV